MNKAAFLVQETKSFVVNELNSVLNLLKIASLSSNVDAKVYSKFNSCKELIKSLT
ncbi:hypothetical protein J6W20_00095 [bacterium]|nr:hypothetical protein [bacterium]